MSNDNQPQKFHQDLDLDKWAAQSIFEIMGNIGSEVSRTIKWKQKGREEIWMAAFDRSLELFDISKTLMHLTDGQRKEIYRSREVWADFIVGDNEYKSTAENIQKYFDQFVYAWRNTKSLSRSEI